MLRKLLLCECLPERIFGHDVDYVLAYRTEKVVAIQDRTLGIIKILMVLAIFCYIFIYQMWYAGTHFEMSAVSGVARMQWQHPTRGCNPSHANCMSEFSSLQELPYCEQYTGNDQYPTRAPCMYFDAFELPESLPRGILLPTYIEKYEQRLACAADSVECNNKYLYVDGAGKVQSQSGDAVPVWAAFVADVDDFTLLIDHSFRTSNGVMSKNGLNMKGYFQVCFKDKGKDKCEERQPLVCKRKECKDSYDSALLFSQTAMAGSAIAAPSLRARERHSSRGDLALDQEGDQYLVDEAAREYAASARTPVGIAISVGDVFSLRSLLTMAGVSLDDPSAEDKQTKRMRGTAIVVRVEYSNWRHWTFWLGEDYAEYTISVTSRPAEKFKYRYVKDQGDNSRVVRADYGVFIIVDQGGEIAFFNLQHTLIVLTTALGLLLAANTVTDMLALYVLPDSELYTKVMIEYTQDIHHSRRQSEQSEKD